MRLLSTALALVIVVGASVAASGAGCTKACCAAKKKKPDQGAVGAVDPAVDMLLGKIEAAGGKMKSFQGEMLFTVEQLMADAIDHQRGKLYYRRGDKTPRFLIHFDEHQQINLDDDEPEPWVKADDTYAFDGLWLTRKNARTKMIQRWEVAREGQDQEMFRLGKGPFPLPFAIKKADVLKEFEATLAAADPNDPAGTAHLVLIPKKDSSYAEKYIKLELWVAQETATTEQIRYETTDSEIHTVRWSKIELDKDISSKMFELKSPGRDWTVEEVPLE